ncbi:MAG: TrkH family potassium uptake protein [Acidobacteria bacterium]|nr:TrkH family potassium uptake protein [Acidobacteriota bacterium]
MRLSIIVAIAGGLLRAFGFMFVWPIAVAAYYREWTDLWGFALAGVVAVALGQLMRRSSPDREPDLRRIEALAIVSGTWLVVAMLGAVPYVWAGLSPVDGLFESMSGFTTTGATILTDFSVFGRSLMFWRALTQWIGGMGVIMLFVAILPRLAMGVGQLFFAEAPGPSDEKLTPQIRKTAAVLWRLYAALTLAEVVALMVAGMSPFDAICHSMTTLAAGGFSPHPESIAGYDSPAVEWIICVFMFLAGANFALQFRALSRPSVLIRNEEFRVYTLVVLVATVLVAGFLWQAGGAFSVAVRHGLFQTLSILTTTGFASVDFNLWGDQPRMVLLVLMFIGGCAGSAAGGPKVVRHMLIGRYTLTELRRMLHPRAVLPVKADGKVISDGVMRTVLVFFLFYVLTFALCAMAVILLGADLVTGVTATMATLGNVGPGLEAVGPMASFGPLHPLSKLVLTAAMWVGRLEVLTVLALLRIEVWRSAHWRS